MSMFYLPFGKKNAKPSRHRQKAARFFEKFPRPGGQASAGTGHRCTEAVAGHSRRIVKCAVQGENRSASRRDLSRTSSFSSVPKASGSWETAERISNSKGSMGNIQRKNPAKVPCETEYNLIRPVIEKWTVFLLSTFTSVENLAKNMFSFSIEMLHSRRGFPHRRLCPSRLRSPISSAQAMETGLALPEGGSFESKWKVAESED